MKITVPVDIPQERLHDLIVTSVEHSGYGSFNYSDARKPPHDVADELDTYEYPLHEGGSITFNDKYEEEDGAEELEDFILDLPAIQRGLEIMAHAYPRHFQDIVSESGDVITADVFLQCALLGEIVYG